MANKFFYNRVYNLARIVSNISLIIALIAAMIIAFSIISDSKLTDTRDNYGIKNSVTVYVGAELEKRMFFDYDKEEYSEQSEVIYPITMDLNKTGKHEIIIKFDGKTFISNLIVADS